MWTKEHLVRHRLWWALQTDKAHGPEHRILHESTQYAWAGYYDPMSIGFDIETGGHVFQIMFTNGTGLIEPQFIGLTQTNFRDGAKGIRLGFNFTRVFTVKEIVIRKSFDL